MGKIVDLYNKLKSKTVDQFHADIMAIIRSEEEFILNLNREQMQEGKMPDGSNIGFYKSDWYAKVKGHSYVDLFLTGDMYYDMYIYESGPETFGISSRDSKVGKLIGEYGDFFGLTEENKKKLAARLKPKFTAYFKSLFHVGGS